MIHITDSGIHWEPGIYPPGIREKFLFYKRERRGLLGLRLDEDPPRNFPEYVLQYWICEIKKKLSAPLLPNLQ